MGLGGLFLSHAQTSVYESSSFQTLSTTHQSIAILPFYASLDLDQGASKHEDLKKLEEREGYAVQTALANFFKRREKRRTYTIAFQDIKKTNELLSSSGISMNNLNTFTSQELAKILGVDAIISGDIDLNALISQGVPEGLGLMDFFTGESDYGRIAIKLSDGQSGKLLWKFEHIINRKAGKDTEDIIETMMRRSTRKFPYDRQKN